MNIPRAKALAIGLVLGSALLASACGGDEPSVLQPTTTPAPIDEATTPDPSDIVAARGLAFDEATGQVRSRFVTDGYVGPAWPVPLDPLEGAHVNDIEVALTSEGDAVGTDYVPAGTRLEIRAVDGTDLVEFDWADGVTATASREDFWVIGEFVEFKNIVVDIDGVSTPIGESDLLYHRVGVGSFDDRDTPEFDAIANKIRQYLRCEDDRWKIANQYFSIDVVAAGIHEDDPEQVELGVQGIEWGMAQSLAPDAVFSLHRECDDTTARDYGETHHSTQWLAALGRGAFDLAASPYAGEHRSTIDAAIDHVETLSSYLTTTDVRDHWIERWLYEPNGDVFTHKFYMRAAGLGLASALTDNATDADRWSAEALVLAERGMEQQRPDGVNPERGGPDVRYQMYGTWLGIVYRSTLVDGDHRDGLASTISDAIEWESTRMDPVTGVMEIEGSTRSCKANSVATEYHPYHMLSAYLLWAHSEPGNDHLFAQAVLADAGHRTGGNMCDVTEEDS